MFTSYHYVVDAGAGHVAAGVFVPARGGRLRLEEFALEMRSSDPAADGAWMEGTAEALAAVAARRQGCGPAALAVPGHFTLTKFIKIPAIAPAQRAPVIAFEAAQAIPYPLEAVVWDHLVMAGDQRELEIMLTAVKRDVMESLCAAAESAGFPVRRAAASGLTLHRAFRFNYPGVTVPVLVVDIGARTTNVVLAGPGGRFYARTLALGGGAVSAVVAAELKLDFARAEALKRHVLADPPGLAENSAARAAVQRATGEFIGRLQLEILRTAGNFSLRTGAAKPAALYLTGGGSLLPGVAAALAEKLGVPVERYDPWRNVEMSERARAAGAAAASHVLANLVGLAVLAAGESGESGLLPPRVLAAVEFRRRQPMLLGAATLLALALVPPLWHFHRRAADDTGQIRQLRAEVAPLRAAAERSAQGLEQLARAQNELSVLRSLAVARTNWLGFLAGLQDRLAEIEDVWLDQLSVVPPSPNARPHGAVDPAASAQTWQLRLSGRLLDAHNPWAKVSPDSYARVKRLLAGMADSPFVAAVENERFDHSQPGLLRFEVTLVVNPQHPL